jgi:isoleucyl-tRNA synthetase
MSDYKNTLNLPQTDFPMKASLAQREPEILKKWQENQIYAKLRAERKGKPKFILLDGPIYSNGDIHVGHAINRILKDIIVKSKSQSGFDAPLVPGWDCHGLPIELNVEKKHGKPGQKINASEFRAACREYAKTQVAVQRQAFQRLGVMADWDHPYLTMDFKFEADIIRSLAKIIGNKHLQKGYKPVHWCLDCASALAEAEVEYAEKTSSSIDVRFTVVDNMDFWGRFDSHVHKGMGAISVPIWTTTPWTLPANEAVSLNPMLQYALISTPEPEQFLIAEDLLPSVLQRYNIGEHTVLGRITGEKLLGLKLKHPFYDKQVPIVLGEHVTVESGTGAVHTAPAHGVDDYVMGKKYHLPLENPVGDDGCYKQSVTLFAGMHVSKVNEKILEALRLHHALIHQESLRHSYPHCWRHKTPLIFRATPQWFISMEQNGLRALALQAIEKVEWLPDWGKLRIKGMIDNRPDWCISRQRTWGVPLALFIHKETGDLHPNTIELMEKVAQRVESQGIDAWYTLDIKDFLGKEADDYQKVMDVLDVWFDSGVAHECVLRMNPDLAFPADIILEGSDQHRGWFQSLLLTSVAMNGSECFKEVLTHGFVVDPQGRKMSKSIGNVVAPDEVTQALGADILRLWAASVDYSHEINASKELVNRMAETYRRIRNTARFLLANLHGFDPEKDLLPTDELLMLDRWAIDKTRRVQEEILQAYADYEFHLVVQKLHHFCIEDLGGFYLDIIKDRQYTMQTNSRGRRSAQTALYHIAQALVRWLAPIMSFTAEEIWQYLPGESASGKKSESVLLTTWYTDLARLPNDIEMNEAYWEKIHAVRDAVNKEIENQRKEGKLGSALEAEVYLYCAPNLKAQLDTLQNELRFVLITSFAEVIAEHAGPIDTIATEVPGLSLKVKTTINPKCERCWHRRADVDANKEYPGLCGRCVENVAGAGEEREYA